MQECIIVCEKGYVADEDTNYTCGILSNYTWSHITVDNPLGTIYDCTSEIFDLTSCTASHFIAQYKLPTSRCLC